MTPEDFLLENFGTALSISSKDSLMSHTPSPDQLSRLETFKIISLPYFILAVLLVASQFTSKIDKHQTIFSILSPCSREVLLVHRVKYNVPPPLMGCPHPPSRSLLMHPLKYKCLYSLCLKRGTRRSFSHFNNVQALHSFYRTE